MYHHAPSMTGLGYFTGDDVSALNDRKNTIVEEVKPFRGQPAYADLILQFDAKLAQYNNATNWGDFDVGNLLGFWGGSDQRNFTTAYNERKPLLNEMEALLLQMKQRQAARSAPAPAPALRTTTSSTPVPGGEQTLPSAFVDEGAAIPMQAASSPAWGPMLLLGGILFLGAAVVFSARSR